MDRRRRVPSWYRLLALLAIFGLIAAACGGDDDGGDTGAGQAPITAQSGSAEDMDPNGTLRLGYDLQSSSGGAFGFDPQEEVSGTSDLGLYHWIYGGLMRPQPDGTLVPELAERAEVVDANTIEVELRDNLQTPDGTVIDANTVKASLDSNLARTDVTGFIKTFFALSNVEVTSPTSLTLTIGDGTAAGWFDKHMGAVETVIVPPGTNFDRPMGAGPYQVTDFAPLQRVVLEKNPNYWDAENIRVPRIEITNVLPTGNNQPSSISAGQVDYVRISSLDERKAVSGSAEVLSRPDPDGLATMMICKSDPPLSDVKVRQAMAYATDREVINEVIFDGEGTPAWDAWPEGHRFFNEQWKEHYAHDPQKARELLAEAGYADGFEVDIMPIVSSMPMAEILQQQWADVGIRVNLVTTNNYVQDALIDAKAPLTIVPVNPTESGKLYHWTGTAVANLCQYDDERLADLAARQRTVSSQSQEAVDIWHQITDIANEEVLSIFFTFQPRWSAYSPDRVGNVEQAHYVLQVPDIWQLYVKR